MRARCEGAAEEHGDDVAACLFLRGHLVVHERLERRNKRSVLRAQASSNGGAIQWDAPHGSHGVGSVRSSTRQAVDLVRSRTALDQQGEEVFDGMDHHFVIVVGKDVVPFGGFAVGSKSTMDTGT